MLSHLIYVSSRKPECTEQEIEKILASCKENNLHRGITGVLLYSEAQFLQYIEGPYKELSSLYDKIKGDKRHKNTIMISSSPIKERSFPSWQMAARSFSTAGIEFRTAISDLDKPIFEELLNGKSMEGNKAIPLIKKFFK